MAKSATDLLVRGAAAASDAAAKASRRLSGDAQTGAKHKDLTPEITALRNASYADLQAKWLQHFQHRAPKRLNRDQLELGIAWKLQAQMHGGLNAKTRRRLDELAVTLETHSDPTPKRTKALRPGTRLLRAWGGETHEVLVIEEGFVWRGRTWLSLSVIAREITGTHWSGPRFFGLGRVARQQKADISA